MPILQRTRHEHFIRMYVKTGGNGAEAYRLAAKVYPVKQNSNPKCYKVIACRILKYPEVQKRYKELQAAMAKRADITEEKILSDYQEALNMAKVQEKPADIVNAATAQAKLVGLMRDRVEAGQPGSFDNMENISEIIEQVRDSAGAEAALALSRAFGLGDPEPAAPRAPAGHGEVNEEEADLIDSKPASNAVN